MKRLPALFLFPLVAAALGRDPVIPPTPDKQPEPPFAPSADGAPRMLVPGFEIRELPVQVTNLNNLEYTEDGRLFAGGYDGRYHLLRDSNHDGFEDTVETFWDKPSENYPLGMAVKDGVPYAVRADEVVRFVDTNADGVPDQRETVVKGFDDPALQKLPYLNHRRVDSSIALAFGADGTFLVTMGNAGFNNPYWQENLPPGKAPSGPAHYSTDRRRGCLLRVWPDGKVEHLASGLRYIMSLQFNKHGDLFGTDQEGATWVPNGNPFDELLHLEKGRHYGFPPRHPEFLPHVVDEPSVFDYGPQHQSTCGFRFNGPAPGRGRFGPEFWADDAIVTGEARGKLWRTKLAKTAAGYVAHTQLIAGMGLLVVDCAISPAGDLVISCHTGKPDWGNGPKGQGRLFKIRLADKATPQPVLAWAASETESIIAFDEPLDTTRWMQMAAKLTISAGRFVDAADRLETIRPGYAVVQMQQREKPSTVAVKGARLGGDRRSVSIKTVPRAVAVNYALTSQQPGASFDLMHDLTGLAGEWKSNTGDAAMPRVWLPHPDFTAAREFTRASAVHDTFWSQLATSGTLTLRGQLDLWKVLIPLTQPGSDLGYTTDPEVVTVVFKSDATLKLYAPGAKIEQASQNEARLTITPGGEGKWLPLAVTLSTPARTLDVSFHTARDPRPRALPLRRFLLPFAKPAAPSEKPVPAAEIAGGDWNAGRALYNGKAACATCHKLRGEGSAVGPDLDNLIHRDYASVLSDIANPNAAINPDAAAYLVTLRDGTAIIGTRVGDTAEELRIAQPGGTVATLKKSAISQTEPLATSLMPPGLDKTLTSSELRDLMTYLLTGSSSPPPDQ